MADEVGTRPPWNFWGFKWGYLLKMEDLDYIIDATKLEAPPNKQWLQEDLADVRYDYSFRAGPRKRPIKKRIADTRKTLIYLLKARALLKDDESEVASSLVGSIVSMDGWPKPDGEGMFDRHQEVCGHVQEVLASMDVLSAWLEVCLDRLSQIDGDENKVEKGISPQEQLFGVDLFNVFTRHFAHDRRWQGKVSRRTRSRHGGPEPDGRQEPDGPYVRFACAFAEKAGIRRLDGSAYEKGTIVEFIRARSRRRRRGKRSPEGPEGDTGYAKEK